MPPVEREMIGLLFKGASTVMENIQVSVFLVAWPAFLIGFLGMVQHEKAGKKGGERAKESSEAGF